jgi:hypothetical protein
MIGGELAERIAASFHATFCALSGDSPDASATDGGRSWRLPVNRLLRPPAGGLIEAGFEPLSRPRFRLVTAVAAGQAVVALSPARARRSRRWPRGR